jgi:PAP2 superfamily
VSTTTIADLLDRAESLARSLRATDAGTTTDQWRAFDSTAYRLLHELVGPERVGNHDQAISHARLGRLALFVVITTAGSSLLNTVVKTAVHRLRPAVTHPVAHEPGPSFPSGHAQAAVVGYAVLLLVLLPILHGVWRRVAVTFAVLMVLAIGFSQIALGVHYLSDVVGGYVLGAAWVTAIAAVFNPMRVDRGRWPVDGGEALGPRQGSRLSGTTAGDEELGHPQ